MPPDNLGKWICDEWGNYQANCGLEWYNSIAPNFEDIYGGNIIWGKTTIGNQQYFLRTAMPEAGDFSYTMKIDGIQRMTNTVYAGIFIVDTSGNGFVLVEYASGIYYAIVSAWVVSYYTTWFSSYYGAKYLQLVRKGTTLYEKISEDGIVYTYRNAGTFTATNIYVGIYMQLAPSDLTFSQMVDIDFIKKD